MLVSKLRSGTSKTMQLVPVHLDLPLCWKFHCATCSPACVILYHVAGSCKGPIYTYKVPIPIYSSRINYGSFTSCLLQLTFLLLLLLLLFTAFKSPNSPKTFIQDGLNKLVKTLDISDTVLMNREAFLSPSAVNRKQIAKLHQNYWRTKMWLHGNE